MPSLRRIITLLVFALVTGLAMPDGSLSSSSFGIQTADAAKRKKRRRRVKRVRRKAKVRKARITARTIAKWQRKGWSHERIVEQALAGRYKVTKRERMRLQKYRVKRALIDKLAAAKAPTETMAAKAPEPKKPINLKETIDPNDINFDEVPPPDGVPQRYANQQPSRKPEEKKALNTSLRPSAPFKPAKASAEETGGAKPKRVVIAAGKE